MGRRIAYGNAFSENGWPMVDTDSCTWIKVPGANNVSLQIQNGLPLAVIRAWCADFDEHVEPLRDPDSACWTSTNSVGSSNHLSGTAVDLNWNSHPFRILNAGFTQAQISMIRELLEFYEGMIWWGNDWNSPKDAMHFQMGYDTYDRDADRPEPKVVEFVARKIRADGLSTFRRGNAPTAHDPAKALADATGLDLSRATGLLPAIRDGLVASGCNSVPRIAMWLAQVGHESVSFQYTEEIAKNGRYAPYIGRTWIQITWESNYRKFSEWCWNRGLVPTADYFVVNYRELALEKWAGIGAAWYWTVERPMNDLVDAGDSASWNNYRGFNAVTAAINGGTNGLQDRINRHQRALAVGDRLLTLLGGGDDMAAVPQEQWDKLFNAVVGDVQSLSPYRKPGEGTIGNVMQVIRYIDLMKHVEYVEESAIEYGDFDSIERIIRSAKGLGADTSHAFVRRAQNTLKRLEAENPSALTDYLKSKGLSL